LRQLLFVAFLELVFLLVVAALFFELAIKVSQSEKQELDEIDRKSYHHYGQQCYTTVIKQVCVIVIVSQRNKDVQIY
jgi:hypothetical protein